MANQVLRLWESVLQGLVDAAPDDDLSLWADACSTACISVCRAMAACCLTAASTVAPPLPADVKDEMLVLTLNLFLRLQQLRKAGTGGSSSSGSSSTDSMATGAARTREMDAVGTLAHLLLILCLDLLDALPGSSAGFSVDAAAATPAQELMFVWQQQAGALFTAVEAFVRDGTSTTSSQDKHVVLSFAAMCSVRVQGRPRLLLRLAQGGSSEQQAAFFNLLVSLLKVSRTCVLVFEGTKDGSTPVSCVIASAAIGMLQAGCVGDAGSSPSGSRSDGSVSLWLLVLGRCCWQWAEALQQLGRQHGSWSHLIQKAQQQQQHEEWRDEPDVYDITQACFFFRGRPIELSKLLHDLSCLLREGSSSSGLFAGLSAAGYDLGPILQGLEAVDACYPEVAQTEGVPDAVVADRVGGLIRALLSLGEALSVFAVRNCCNNPSCSNMGGLSEASIVSGKGSVCAGCKVARYCGKPCQVANWKAAHKGVCKMLAAAAAKP